MFSWTDPARLVALITLLGAVVAVWRWFRPRWRRFTAKVEQLFESVNGRPAMVDKATGREVSPAVPSLGLRLENLEDAVRDRAQLEQRMTAVETLVAEHGNRLTAIEGGHQVERITGHVAQAQAYKAIEEVAKNGGIDDSVYTDVDDLDDGTEL
jgi:hypothetical protein